MRGARETRVCIPDDLAVVALTISNGRTCSIPRLTVIAQPTLVMGEQTLQLVLSRLADPWMPVRRVMMRPAFVHRESCGCPPG